MNLDEIRQQIDEIDRTIVTQFEKRMEAVKEIAAYKSETNTGVLDKEREDKKIAAVRAMTHNSFNAYGAEELYRQIMAISRQYQYGILKTPNSDKSGFLAVNTIKETNLKVIFQGADGAYSQAAMQHFFGDEIRSFHVDTFREAMQDIEDEKADFAVLPIENSTAGIVGEIYDLLAEFNQYIVGEQIIPIEHCLLVNEGSDINSIKTIYSHPQSLMQCSEFLRKLPWTQAISMKNNAFAARKVAEEKDLTQAAIASEHAAKVYGLKVLQKAVNDDIHNATRFLIISKKKIYCEDAKKVSICFEIPHESGSLYHVLSHFICNNLNMTKIESRPIKDRTWEYRFFIDFEGKLTDVPVVNALRGLEAETCFLKVLGNY